ncbi:MAG: hypothetical protein WEA99_10850 [Brumimicrobium sp.]
MKPLIVLVFVFLSSCIATKIFKGNIEFALSGRVAMSTMLIFTAVSHFIFTQGMEMMLPGFIPYKTEVVYLTGIIEIVAAIGIFIPSVRMLAAWLVIAFFILVLPANIYASINQVNIEKASFEGKGSAYLWFRIPLQVFFIIWVYFSAIKK